MNADSRERRDELNQLLLPPAGTTRVHRERVDERGIPMPSWWTENEADSSAEGNTILALQLKRGRRR